MGASLAGIGLAAATIWTAADLVKNRVTERVPYRTVERIDGVELRRYPETVRVRTAATDQHEVFFRLFEYIDSPNHGGMSLSTTAPVETDTDAEDPGDPEDAGASETNESISMTTPVETTQEGGVTMSSFPAECTPETAPKPTNDAVDLVDDPPRTLAALGFSRWTPSVRVTLKEQTTRRRWQQTTSKPLARPVSIATTRHLGRPGSARTKSWSRWTQ